MSRNLKLLFPTAAFFLLLVLLTGCFAIDPWLQFRAGTDGLSISIERNGRIPSQTNDRRVPRPGALTQNETRLDLPH